MDSHALLKKYILLFLKQNGDVIGDDVPGLVKGFDLAGAASNTQVMRALRSLQYNDKKIKILRPIEEYGGGSDPSIRSYRVKAD